MKQTAGETTDRRNVECEKHTGQEVTFYRILNAVFWSSLVFTAGYGWYYTEHQIPEHFSIAEGRGRIYGAGSAFLYYHT